MILFWKSMFWKVTSQCLVESLWCNFFCKKIKNKLIFLLGNSAKEKILEEIKEAKHYGISIWQYISSLTYRIKTKWVKLSDLCILIMARFNERIIFKTILLIILYQYFNRFLNEVNWYNHAKVTTGNIYANWHQRLRIM